MDSITRRFGILCLGVLAAATAACATNNVSQCEATGILCPAGTHCAAAEPVCITDTNLCGNAHLDPGEVCDDGNTKDGDECSHDCTSDLKCGNSKIDVAAKVPEQCDDGDKNGQLGDPCSATCQLVRCGNGVVEQGEECDDGNTTSGDGCSDKCQSEFCGNGHIDPGEVCDPPTPGKCSDNCRSLLRCGNAILDPGEECDDGPNNGDGQNCRSDCVINRCGDGFVDTAPDPDRPGNPPREDCDPAPQAAANSRAINPTEDATCNLDCTAPKCGDSKVNRHFTPKDANGNPAAGPEQCDNGAANNDNADCTATCQINVCGDGHQDTTGTTKEECDHGALNGAKGDTCTKDCHLVKCGNGVLDQDEECDDGAGNGSGARCNANCKFNVCGDGDPLTGVEQCDDGSGGIPKDSTTCDHDCTFAVCGDGYQNVTAGEQCDDGDKNGTATSLCSLTCHTIKCGNGVIEQGEECDDGANNGLGKRCNASCKFNVCGDGDPLIGVEQCDTGPGDSKTCDADCTFPVCGDGHKNMAAGEACDNGTSNGSAADPCDSFCQLKGCGNGIVEPGEQCDPGTPGTDTATCNFDCTVPVCGDGHQNSVAGETCDDGPDNGNPCDYGDEKCKRCNATCTALVSPGGPFCGDAILNGTTSHPEACDLGTLLNTTQCAYGDTVCLSDPKSRCKSDCSDFAGALNGPFCGDGTVQPQEECDPGGNTLTPANTAVCNSDCTFPVCGDGLTNGKAGEKCDDRNTSACGTCSADCSTKTSAAATGQIVTKDASGTNIADGDTFTLNDGFNQQTFEFDVGGVVTPGNIAISIVIGTDKAADVATKIIAAVKSSTLNIGASLGATNATVDLTNGRATSHGNQPIGRTGNIALTGHFTFTDMAGGLGGDCDTGVGCVIGDDCTSGVCTNHRCE